MADILAETADDLTPAICYQAVRESETSGSPDAAALLASVTAVGVSGTTLTLTVTDAGNALGVRNLLHVPQTSAKILSAVASRCGFLVNTIAIS